MEQGSLKYTSNGCEALQPDYDCSHCRKCDSLVYQSAVSLERITCLKEKEKENFIYSKKNSSLYIIM